MILSPRGATILAAVLAVAMALIVVFSVARSHRITTNEEQRCILVLTDRGHECR